MLASFQLVWAVIISVCNLNSVIGITTLGTRSTTCFTCTLHEKRALVSRVGVMWNVQYFKSIGLLVVLLDVWTDTLLVWPSTSTYIVCICKMSNLCSITLHILKYSGITHEIPPPLVPSHLPCFTFRMKHPLHALNIFLFFVWFLRRGSTVYIIWQFIIILFDLFYLTYCKFTYRNSSGNLIIVIMMQRVYVLYLEDSLIFIFKTSNNFYY